MSVKYYKKVLGKKDKNYSLEIKKCENEYHSRKEHFHNEWSINLIEEGKTTVNRKCGEHTLEKGVLSIIPPDVLHDCHPSKVDEWKFTLLYISDEWLEKAFDINLEKDKVLYTKLSEEKQKYFLEMVEEIIHLDDSEKLEEILLNLVNEFIFEKFDSLRNEKIIEKETLIEIKEFVEINYKESLSLDDLSEKFVISKYHLLRSFEEVFGVTPLGLQKILRFNEAKELLKQNMEIAEIALELGYYDQSHFSKEFKSFSGVSPNKYKKQQ